MTEPTGTRTPDALRGELSTLRRSLGAVVRTGLRRIVTEAYVLRPPLLPLDAPLVRDLPPAVRRKAVWLPQVLIVAFAVFVFLVGVGRYKDETFFIRNYSGMTGLQVGIAAAAPLLLALVRPVAAWWLSMVLIFVVAGTYSGFTLDWPFAQATFASHIVLMGIIALRSTPVVPAAMWVLTVGMSILAVNISSRYASAANIKEMAGASVVVVVVSVLLRVWRGASREATASGELTVQERSKRTLLEERTAIARELHDVVAHHMSVIAIQAEAAPYRVADPPAELTASFATIRENAVAALAELRRVLGIVRTADYQAPHAPQPTLADLDRLLANVRDVGLGVELTTTGAPRELPQGVEVSAYRIIQEALSNALRHAPGADAKVELSYVLGGLALRIVNGPPTGERAPSPGAGHGVTGMRERVAMLGGRMTAGPTTDGGYEVAVLLLAEDPAAEGADDLQGDKVPGT